MNALAPRPTVTIGDPFPCFQLRDARELPSTIDPRSSIVVLYRGHWCGHCRSQLHDLAHQSDALRALGFKLIAISSDDASGANDMRADSSDAIQILTDADATAIQRLGLADRDEKVDHVIARPAVFIVDSDGVVRYRYVSRSAADRPTIALLLLAAESLVRPAHKESLPT